jgi:hypothetical protein
MAGAVTTWPRHVRTNCLDASCLGCCLDTLFLCAICGGAEGSLPTDCPGERMHDEVDRDVYAGTTDYVRGQGWIEKPRRVWEGFQCQ